VTLAQDVGGTGLTLRIEAVEFLLQPLLGRLAGVDGTADTLAVLPGDARLGLATGGLPGFSPKNLGPDQAVPVIAAATWLSERYLRSSNR
jgi:hypothetical protein